VELLLGYEFSGSFPQVFRQSLLVAVLPKSHSFTFVHISNLPQIKYFYHYFLEIPSRNRQTTGRRPFLLPAERHTPVIVYG
jgi:hypothetical protein